MYNFYCSSKVDYVIKGKKSKDAIILVGSVQNYSMRGTSVT